jgi:hypothetical protein
MNGDFLAVCGDVFHDEYLKNPERFEHMSSEKLSISDWIYLTAIYLYNPAKMTLISVSFTVIYLGCMLVAWPGANAQWITFLSLVLAIATTAFMYAPFAAVFLGTPLVMFAFVASFVGGWFGL